MSRWVAGLCAAFLCSGCRWAIAAEPTPGQVEFFEQRIRPVLVDSCYRCHSAQRGRNKGGLMLDSRAGLRQGGDSGPAIVPGKPEESLLLRAIRYRDKDLRMPPESAGGKLPSETIAAFAAWIQAGAPDPRTAPAGTSTASGHIDWAKARAHWAFQPVRLPPIPPWRNPNWVRTPVDAFVLAKLEAKGLQPAPPADPRTLMRRVYLDLIGLPPSPKAMTDYLQDNSPDAFEKVVDRLLDSPRYGERWGRYWLDVARYADTKGYVFQEERRYPYSYTYRDYVIRAFNSDKPYDRFLEEQLAADRLATNTDHSALAALGFLTLGRRFLNNQNDIIDDRIDVVSRGLLGLTVGCARCHDHKFDPIPSRDYYALHGVFASSEEPTEEPLLAPLADTPAYRAYLKAQAAIKDKEEAEIEKEVQEFLAQQRDKTADYLLAAHDAQQLGAGESLKTFALNHKIEFKILQRWMAFLDARAKSHDPILSPWFAFAALPEQDFKSETEALVERMGANDDPAHPLNGLVAAAFAGQAPLALADVAAIYGQLFHDADRAWTAQVEAAAKAHRPNPTGLPQPEQEALRQLLYAQEAPPNLPGTAVRQLIARLLDNVTVKYRQELAALEWKEPGAPARAMALEDRPRPHNSPIFLRGNPANPGPEAPREFLEILAGPNSRPFTQGSGRLELAEAVASPDNPLTARVFVNRVWAWHFGAGFVHTPSDFGVRTPAPVQQDLLDWLSATFMAHGWSVKQLQRLILLSNTYRQACDPDPRTEAADPDNLLLHHFPRHRLDFEALRDTLLAVSGQLDLTVGGQAVDILDAPFSGRRTVYGFIDRQNLPGLFRTFDLANPDTSAPQRFTTTVPQQALFLMNSAFVLAQARALARRPELQSCRSDAQKIRHLYELCYQRAPAPEEATLAENFLKHHAVQTAPDDRPPPKETKRQKAANPAPLSDWEQLTQVLLLANELVFVE